jgi:hypothetical protein
MPLPDVTLTLKHATVEKLLGRLDEIRKDHPEWILDPDQQELCDKLKAAIGG